jgi:CheY-like chemotaxis protein/HPt (histidine-containing phosphotransfer) domain-containing protein
VLPSHSDGERAHIRFEIADTGIGISPEAQARLFSAFAQADSSTTRRYGGTGLGLAICARLVEAMGGTISLKSERGAGSVFSFELPFESISEDISASEFAGRRALVYAASGADCDTLARYLEGAGFTVVKAGTDSECLFALKTAAACGAPFDIAILSAGTAGTETAAVVKTVQESAEAVGTRLLVLYATTRDNDELRGLSFAASLKWPAKKRQLLVCIAELLNASSDTVRSLSESSKTSEPAPTARILVAEDNPINQKFIRVLLERWGHRIALAANGMEAVRSVQLVPCDVVLMDCQMPDMDGYEAARHIRALSPSLVRQPVIIAVTANAIAGERERCLDAGMDDYISKPIRPEELRSKLEGWLRRTVEEGAVVTDFPFPVERIWTTADERHHVAKLLAELGKDDINELLSNFGDHSSESLRALSAAVEDRNLAATAAIAHNLRGGCGILGLRSLERSLSEIEQQARDNEHSRCADSVRLLLEQFGPVLSILRPQ